MNRAALCTALLLLLAGATCDRSIEPVGEDVLSISAVQGVAHRSPREGSSVEIQGIVTAVRRGARVPGFWLQDAGRGKSGASSGIFIRTNGDPEILPGNLVRVRGRVVEYERAGSLPLTQIDAESTEKLRDSGPAVPGVRIGPGGHSIPEIIEDDRLQQYEPSEDAIDFFESLEGMLVEVEGATVSGPTSRFGDFVVIPRLRRRDAVRTDRGGALLTAEDENSERIIVDTSLSETKPSVSVGDTLTGPLRGVIHYDFGNYRLMATSIPSFEPFEGVRSSPEPAGPEHLTIASYNVLNLAATGRAERFSAVAHSIVRDLGSPDVVGLQEIQDDTGGKDDGTVSAEETLRRLTDAIVEAGGPRYVWRQIDPLDDADGGAPGSNIRVAYLVNPARVEIIDRGAAGPMEETEVEGEGGAVRLSLSPGRIGTRASCFLGEGSSDETEGTRKSLALEIRFAGRSWFLVNNHLKSKRGDQSTFGASQPPERRTEEQRTCQAAVIADFVAEILQRNPAARIVVLGDLNEHEFRRPIARLREAGLIDLIDRVPLDRRYTYNYLGNSQVLDHILVSPSLENDASLSIRHVNSVFPESVAASDHDPLLATVEVR